MDVIIHIDRADPPEADSTKTSIPLAALLSNPSSALSDPSSGSS
jgi:hypothetical protein